MILEVIERVSPYIYDDLIEELGFDLWSVGLEAAEGTGCALPVRRVGASWKRSRQVQVSWGKLVGI